MDPRLLPLTLITSLVVLTIPCCVCQNYQQYQICSQTSFQCGSITGIGYPFWGGNRPLSCGYPGFEVHCQNDILRLNISLITYRVLSINNSTQTLKVARDDMWNNVCPRFLLNTTLEFPTFSFSATAGDQNVVLYYGCTLNQEPATSSLNQFNCTVNQTNSLNFYVIGEATELGKGVHCNTRISIPVNQSAAWTLVRPDTPTSTLLQGLQSGFSIQWWTDNGKCSICMQSGGFCGSDLKSGSFVCHCPDQPHGLSCSVTPTKEGRLHAWRKTVLIIGVSFGSAGIVRIILYIRKQRRLRKLDKESNQNVNKFLLSHGSLAPKRYNYGEIKKMTKSFTDKLGQGGYGIVYKGKLTDDQLVAVKVLNETDENGEEFINEVASISQTSHVNIVNLLGFCYERKKRALIYEFMPNKSLDKFIYKRGSEDYLEWEKLYDIAVGVARGLEYLHRGCNTKIVHFDIKPQNILLDQDFCPKISDFGLAKLFKKKQSMMSMLGARGTIGYIAPEVFSRNFGGVSHKSDVYSYGMMLLEMAGARKNVEIEAIQSSEDYFPDKIYEHVLLKNKKLDDVMTEENEDTARKMLMVGLWCIQTAPSDRPSMTKVVEMLEGSLESIQIPPKPLLSSPALSGQQFSTAFSVNIEAENSAEG